MLVVGIIGAILLAFCAVPQAISCARQGHSNGIDWTFLVMWTTGEIGTFFYTLSLVEIPWPLIFNYALNLGCLGVIIWFKLWPRRGR